MRAGKASICGHAARIAALMAKSAKWLAKIDRKKAVRD
jgi:hypothetical protein